MGTEQKSALWILSILKLPFASANDLFELFLNYRHDHILKPLKTPSSEATVVRAEQAHAAAHA